MSSLKKSCWHYSLLMFNGNLDHYFSALSLHPRVLFQTILNYVAEISTGHSCQNLCPSLFFIPVYNFLSFYDFLQLQRKTINNTPWFFFIESQKVKPFLYTWAKKQCFKLSATKRLKSKKKKKMLQIVLIRLRIISSS